MKKKLKNSWEEVIPYLKTRHKNMLLKEGDKAIKKIDEELKIFTSYSNLLSTILIKDYINELKKETKIEEKCMKFEDWEELMNDDMGGKRTRAFKGQGDIFEQFEYIIDHIDN